MMVPMTEWLATQEALRKGLERQEMTAEEHAKHEEMQKAYEEALRIMPNLPFSIFKLQWMARERGVTAETYTGLIDIKRMEAALASERIQVPPNMTCEQLRDFIIAAAKDSK